MLGWLFDKGEGELDGDDEHAVAFDLSDPTSTKSGPNQPLSPDRVPPFSTAGYSFSALQHNPSPGFASFVVEHSNALLELIGLRDERLALAHLAEHDALVIGVAHVRQWFFIRHTHLNARVSELKDEVSNFFLLDAAADAARNYFGRHPEDASAAAQEGVARVTKDLGTHDDPRGLRAFLAKRVQAWLTLIKEERGESGDPRSARRGGHSARGEQAMRMSARGAGPPVHFPRSARSPPQPQHTEFAHQQNLRQPHSARLAGGLSNFPAGAGGFAPRQHQRMHSRRSATTQDPSRALLSLGYKPLGPIAAGAFSTILRCKNVNDGTEVAVKSFDGAKCAREPTQAALRDNELEVLRLLRAAAAASQAGGVGHPHIANMLAELGDIHAAHQHAVLEYCAGGTLKRYLTSSAKHTPEGLDALVVGKSARQLAAALFHLHYLGVMHGDLKPANILLIHDGKGLDGGLKLCDFGFACICGEGKLKSYCGTPAYLAPELASPTEAHKGYHGRPVDMWALGCVLYEMIHNKLAFTSQEAFSLEALVRAGNHAPFKQGLLPAARAVISGLLTGEATKRLTASEVLKREWVGGDGVDDGSDRFPPPQETRPRTARGSSSPNSPQKSARSPRVGGRHSARGAKPSSPFGLPSKSATTPSSPGGAGDATTEPASPSKPKAVALSEPHGESGGTAVESSPSRTPRTNGGSPFSPTKKHMMQQDEAEVRTDTNSSSNSPAAKSGSGAAPKSARRNGTLNSARSKSARGSPNKIDPNAPVIPFQRKPIEASPFAQFAPKKAGHAVRHPGKVPAAAPGQGLNRTPRGVTEFAQPPQVEIRLASAFPGLEGPGAPTPSTVAAASAKESMNLLREYGEENSSLAEAVLARLTVLCSPHNGAAAISREAAEEVCEYVCANDGVRSVLNVMILSERTASPNLQAYGCSLIGMLCDREERAKRAADNHGIEAVVRAMKAHKNDYEVQTAGCLALGQLASAPERSKEAADLGALSLVVRAMKHRPERAVMQANGCMALANLIIGERSTERNAPRASDPRRSQKAADEGALEMISNALSRHPSHDGVLHWGTTAILRLTHDSAERTQHALRAGAKAALAAAAARPTTRELPAVAAKIELAHRWLAMHEAGGVGPELSKAERVLQDLVFEATAGVLLPEAIEEATGMESSLWGMTTK